ncbi:MULTISPECIES: ActS/PrrB/RegB family redox-sensitive histidine kinase [unclassified Chelatococcus]|uniref:ActS/PrrB/RegB family redox-sensitive histidine kinase n=1 Tax=unclassified Chelatococcus TaxID=2638111 RepID=UPI001BCC1D68|nr:MULTISPECIES: ActS/PrrB/RegB family redox-sensitive histidine kinase [unclassified Chelatococcus]CAH1656502.1 Sensor histidine kinase RegB [Hyphomicrobiales bacterium]MBS7740543.1 ActS/PrrB/RegB family redox-sensitive histidine kinase [Chelatococcus sp. HY11]MBX3544673.1 ActS/PrrB/RegB family redox-sensitive histidine kinase [Chelatococcus sp.]MCO5078214.1 ActS/PrrB/RegB family redox-sensitive histidine kinase [Chelatococcus sp.]CAH1684722.1 Sensor histidine kinase RegB [Hyphomicrobiales ba
MAVNDTATIRRTAQHLRVDTLVRLRSLAVVGQSAAVVGVHFGLGFPFPFAFCFVAIAVSAWLNFALRIRYPISHRLSENAGSLLLGYDILQLSALLYLTGGLENPFAMLLLAPVMISATALQPWRTLALGFMAMVCVTILAFFHLPLPWYPGETLHLPFLYVAGIWCAILLGLAFTGVYAWRVAEEARQLADALAATEFVLAREQHLSQLDGLAAAAAHELGTPLATIALVAKELDKLAPKDGPMAEDITLLREQVARCRKILGTLTSLGTGEAGPLERLTLRDLIEEVANPQRSFSTPLTLNASGEGAQPICRRSPGLLYGLGNLVDNAVDFATSGVVIDASWTKDTVSVVVRDDGPGFAPEVLLRLGDPYVTTRGSDRRGGGEPGDGLGLGLFIAKTLIERSGASIEFSNAAAPDTGAIVTVTWPRGVFERDLDPLPDVGRWR